MATALLTPLQAQASEDETKDESGAETIVVTGVREKQAGAGTKTDTPLMATPQSITVIDSEELVRRNALSDFTNVMRNGKIAMKFEDDHADTTLINARIASNIFTLT